MYLKGMGYMHTNTHDRLIGRMVREIGRLNAYLDVYKDDKEMRLILNSKREAYQRVIELIREDEYEWEG